MWSRCHWRRKPKKLAPWAEARSFGRRRSSNFFCYELYSARLECRVLLQSGFAELARNAGLLEPTEQRSGIKIVVAVDPNGSGPNIVRDVMSLADVARPD